MSSTFPLVSTNDRDFTYVASAAQTVFPVEFPFQDNADVQVFVGGVLQTITTHYTMTGAGNGSGPTFGNVTFLAGQALGQQIRIKGLAPIGRLTDYEPTGKRSRALLNKDFDRLTLIQRELRRDMDGFGDGLAAEIARALAAEGALAATDANLLNRIILLEQGGGGPSTGLWTNLITFGAAGIGGDDTAACQAAIDSGAAIIWCPPGVYGLNANGLTGRSNQVLLGIKGQTIFRLLNDLNAGKSMLLFSSKTNFKVRDITFDYNNKQGQFGSAISLVSCTKAEIVDCEILNIDWYGIAIQSSQHIKTNSNWIERATPATTYPAGTLTMASGVQGATNVVATGTAGVFKATDVGKWILTGGGYASVTGFTDSNHLLCTISTTISDITPQASGTWALSPFSNSVIYFGNISQPAYNECNRNTLVNSGVGGSVRRSQFHDNKFIGTSGAMIFINAEASADANSILGNQFFDSTGVDPLGFPHNGVEAWGARTLIGFNVMNNLSGGAIQLGGRASTAIGNMIFNNGTLSEGAGIALISDGGGNNASGSLVTGNLATVDGGTVDNYGFATFGGVNNWVADANQFNANTTRNEDIFPANERYTFRGRELTYTATVDPPSIANGASWETEILALQLELGDMCSGVAFGADLQGVQLTAYVNSLGHFKLHFENHTGGAIDLPSATATVMFKKRFNAQNT